VISLIKYISYLFIGFLIIYIIWSLKSNEKNISKKSLERAMDCNVNEGQISTNGASLYYKTIGKKDPIIIIHGGPGMHHGYFLPAMLELSKNHQIILYDQRGCGKATSEVIDSDSINIKTFVSDLEVLRKSLGLNKVTLLGHSFGGFLAMQYAIKYHKNLSSLILVGAMPADFNGYNSFLLEFERRIQKIANEINSIRKSSKFKKGDPKAVYRFYRIIFETYLYDPEKIDEISLAFEPFAAINGFKVYDIFDQNLFKSKFDILSDLKNLSIPTLIVHGSSDPIPLETAKRISSAITNSKLVVLKRCGHFPFVEQPEKFFYVLEDFCNQHK
jgi:proline iminopeptidase